MRWKNALVTQDTRTKNYLENYNLETLMEFNKSKVISFQRRLVIDWDTNLYWIKTCNASLIIKVCFND